MAETVFEAFMATAEAAPGHAFLCPAASGRARLSSGGHRVGPRDRDPSGVGFRARIAWQGAPTMSGALAAIGQLRASQRGDR
jgi:proline racemase